MQCTAGVSLVAIDIIASQVYRSRTVGNPQIEKEQAINRGKQRWFPPFHSCYCYKCFFDQGKEPSQRSPSEAANKAFFPFDIYQCCRKRNGGGDLLSHLTVLLCFVSPHSVLQQRQEAQARGFSSRYFWYECLCSRQAQTCSLCCGVAYARGCQEYFSHGF